jgi:phenylalanyl-tRNA synthetase beta chain
MPTATLSRARVAALLPSTLSPEQWEELLFASKAEIESTNGDDLVLSATPDRLDLLSEGGLALYLQGVTGAAAGLPPPGAGGPTGVPAALEVDSSVVPIRPEIGAAIVRSHDPHGLDAGLLAEAIRFQELIHATIGRDRRAASLGIYPLERLEWPVRYSLDPIGSIRFVPLDATEEIEGERFFQEHPMAARYGPLGRLGDRCLVLRDHRGEVLSLPPVLNGRTAGEARIGDRELLLESTGTRERSVREALGLLLAPFVAQRWSVTPVPVHRTSGTTNDGRGFIAPRTVDLSSALVRSVSGLALTSGEVEHRLARARLGVHPTAGGWAVEAPPWRPDLTAPIDVAEDVVLSGGVRAEDGIVPPSRTRGRRLEAVELRRRVATWLLGLGYSLPNTPVLVSEATVARVGGPGPIHLTNPVSAEYAYVRDRLLLSHLDVLARNTRHGYPQRFAEVGPVVVRAPEAEAGASTRYHAGAIVASESAGFADAAALVDYLLRALDLGSVREPVEIAATIPGRAARVRIAGEPVAEIGEIHPRLLSEIGVPVPVAWAELDLAALGPLLGRPGRA